MAELHQCNKVVMVQRAPNHGGSTISALLVAKALLDAGFELDVVLGGRGTAEGEFLRLGVDVHYVPHTNWLQKDRGWRSWRRVLRARSEAGIFAGLFDALKPDLVYCNSIVSFGAMLAAARLGIPVIVHLRENLEQHSELAAPPYGLPIVRHWLRHCAGMLVANSLHTANSVLGDLSAWPVTIVPNAVDATFFQFDKTIQECRSQLGLLEDHRVVGIPGTLRPVKGQLDIVQDLAAIVTEHTDVTVLVSGDTTGRYAQEVLDAIRVNHASNNFRFCGMVTDMPQFYRACDVICVPSKDESFGRVVIEAMSMGLPVVASGVGGIPEILVNGVTGLMADGCDCNWMADQIRRLLSDGELRGRLGQAAACDAQLRFSERRHSESIAQIVQQVMS